ncbi:MAG TPA: hypothetical protein VEP89_03435 [Draconibacterium sp.]|nr:hypothetical protein [Draconibacterium sp.]
MRRSNNNKYDKVGVGFLSGLVLPVIVFFLFYLIGENDVSFFEYIDSMWRIQALVKVGSLCVFTNVAVFWIFLRLKFEKAARGVLGATILYAFVVLISRAF